MEAARKVAMKWVSREVASLPDPTRGPFGLTLDVYKRAHPGRPLDFNDLRTVSEDEARDLVLRYYWFAAGCDGYPLGVDYSAFVLALACDDSFHLRRWVIELAKVENATALGWEFEKENLARDLWIIQGLYARFMYRMRLHTKWPVYYQRWTSFASRTRRRSDQLARGLVKLDV